VLLYGPDYWKEVIDFEALVRHGTIAREDLSLFEFVDDPESAFAILQRELAVDPCVTTPAFAKSKTTVE
jgi:predicted Rossmann-fold nucleotide-binding protein